MNFWYKGGGLKIKLNYLIIDSVDCPFNVPSTYHIADIFTKSLARLFAITILNVQALICLFFFFLNL